MSGKPKYFFVIYLGDERLQSLVDAMRIVADPKQRNISHLTVKGPYNTAQKELLNRDNKIIKGERINVLGAGNFFGENQNTVFLECEDKEILYNIWKRKEERTFPNYHPHITIYDGKDSAFAHQLFQTLRQHKINFSFKVDELGLYSSHDKTSLFNLNMRTNFELLSDVAGKPINENNIGKLSERERIDLIDKLCDRLEKISTQSCYALTQYSEPSPNRLAGV